MFAKQALNLPGILQSLVKPVRYASRAEPYQSLLSLGAPVRSAGKSILAPSEVPGTSVGALSIGRFAKPRGTVGRLWHAPMTQLAFNPKLPYGLDRWARGISWPLIGASGGIGAYGTLERSRGMPGEQASIMAQSAGIRDPELLQLIRSKADEMPLWDKVRLALPRWAGGERSPVADIVRDYASASAIPSMRRGIWQYRNDPGVPAWQRILVKATDIGRASTPAGAATTGVKALLSKEQRPDYEEMARQAVEKNLHNLVSRPRETASSPLLQHLAKTFTDPEVLNHPSMVSSLLAPEGRAPYPVRVSMWEATAQSQKVPELAYEKALPYAPERTIGKTQTRNQQGTWVKPERLSLTPEWRYLEQAQRPELGSLAAQLAGRYRSSPLAQELTLQAIEQPNANAWLEQMIRNAIAKQPR